MRKLFNKIEWPNFLFITITHLIAIIGGYWTIQYNGFYWETLVLAYCFMWLTGMGITSGYHRLTSHLSYSTTKFIKMILLLLGGAAWQGSAREWSCAHRKHHRYVDTDKDPYSIKKGFWHAHIFWVVLKSDQSDESNVQDLIKDPLVMFQDKHYIALATFVSFFLPTAIATLWGDPWGGLIIAGIARLVVNHHLTFFINSWCHFMGRQPYSNKNTARDSGLTAFFTYGEGYHNFHHAFESDYRNGIKFYHWDPSKWLIKSLEKVNLAWGLKEARPDLILKAKLEMDELLHRTHFFPNMNFSKDWLRLIATARQNIEQMQVRLIKLRKEYNELRKIKVAPMMARVEEIKREMKESRKNLNAALNQWQLIIRGQFQIIPMTA